MMDLINCATLIVEKLKRKTYCPFLLLYRMYIVWAGIWIQSFCVKPQNMDRMGLCIHLNVAFLQTLCRLPEERHSDLWVCVGRNSVTKYICHERSRDCEKIYNYTYLWPLIRIWRLRVGGFYGYIMKPFCFFY